MRCTYVVTDIIINFQIFLNFVLRNDLTVARNI
jgi:hypothetical protein